MARITLTARLGNRREVLQRLDHIQKNLLDPRTIIKWAGPKVRDQIVTRTTSGRDTDDRNFRQYSSSYADKCKSGRREPVTLTLTGTMMDNTLFKATGPRSGKVFVQSSRPPAPTRCDRTMANRRGVGSAHHRGAGVPPRKWLGMSPSDLKWANKETREYLEVRARNLLGLTPSAVLAVSGGKVFSKGVAWKVRNPA